MKAALLGTSVESGEVLGNFPSGIMFAGVRVEVPRETIQVDDGHNNDSTRSN
jgi:hypothetical protein